MFRNMGTTDRTLRALIALTILGLWAGGMIAGTLAWVLGVIAVILLATAAVGTCPLYLPFHIDTRPRQQRVV